MAATKKKLISAAIAAAVIPVSVHGAGFGLNTHSAKSGGTSYAGTAVMGEDPATVYYNPAGMMVNDRAAVSAGASYIMPEFDYSDNRDGVPGDKSDEPGLAPSLYYMTPFRDDWAVGLSINAPYGSSTSFSDEWVGRYDGTESDIRGVNINPNLAHRINDQVSVGVGINAQYFDATLTSQNPGSNPPDPSTDIESEVEGDSWGVGYNAGILVEPNDSTRVGLAYRSEISHGLDGDLRFDPGLPAGPTTIDKVPAQASLEVPESATLSFSQGLGEDNRLTLLADAQYTRWSRVDTITVDAGLGPNNPELVLDFQNSWRGSLGTTWEQTDRLTLRAGYTFEESAVKNAETRTPRVPDNHRNWVSLGAGYQLTSGLELDASYSRLFIKDSPIQSENGLDGEFDSSADILSVQATYRY